jgi:hypothetical protein
MTDRPQQPFELTTQRLGALPIVDHFLARIALRGLLERYLPAGDERVMWARRWRSGCWWPTCASRASRWV